MIEGRKRGVIFDVGHGGGSFAWRIAVRYDQARLLAGFDLDGFTHLQMNSGMKDMLNVMDKFLALGMSVDDVIARSTWNPAKEIHHEELGNLFGRLAGRRRRAYVWKRDTSASPICTARRWTATRNSSAR